MLHVVWDPGHGGADRGTRHNGIVEAEYVLTLARLCHAMACCAPGVRSSLLRSNNQEMSLSERGQRSNGLGADLVIHLHVDANAHPGVTGARTYYWGGNGMGRHIGQRILMAMPVALRPPAGQQPLDCGMSDVRELTWRRRAANVMRYHSATTVLLECGFATNPDDAEILKRPEARFALASACLVGVAGLL